VPSLTSGTRGESVINNDDRIPSPFQFCPHFRQRAARRGRREALLEPFPYPQWTMPPRPLLGLLLLWVYDRHLAAPKDCNAPEEPLKKASRGLARALCRTKGLSVHGE
jgi:hypothetical protein